MDKEQVREAVEGILTVLVNGMVRPVGFVDEREEVMKHNKAMLDESVNAIMKLDKPPTVTRKMLQEWWMLANDNGLAGQTWVEDTAAILTAQGVEVTDE